MAKRKLDESGELKRLADEFHRMGSEAGLREMNAFSSAEARAREDRSTSILPMAIIAAVVLVVLLAAGTVFLLRSQKSMSSYPVPDVTGQARTDATSLLTSRGFRVVVQYDASRKDVSRGQVLAQKPPAGTRQERGADVTITVAGKAPKGTPQVPVVKSSTAEKISTPVITDAPKDKATDTLTAAKVTIPDVEGMVAGKARQKLQALGLAIEELTVTDRSQPEQIVLVCSPKPATEVEAGSTVRISINMLPSTIKSSAPSSFVEIPDYAGQDWQAVDADLQAKGFSPAWKYEDSRVQPAGCIIRTEPPAGSQLSQGADIVVYIAQ